MNPSKEQLIDALYNEYVFLCHDDFEVGVDIEPEDYLTMLKDMTYDELVEETCTDETYHLSEFMNYGSLKMKVTEHNVDADLTIKEVEALMELVKEQIANDTEKPIQMFYAKIYGKLMGMKHDCNA